jgi:hypothetical protein
LGHGDRIEQTIVNALVEPEVNVVRVRERQVGLAHGVQESAQDHLGFVMVPGLGKQCVADQPDQLQADDRRDGHEARQPLGVGNVPVVATEVRRVQGPDESFDLRVHHYSFRARRRTSRTNSPSAESGSRPAVTRNTALSS